MSLERVSIPKEIKDKITAPIPSELIKQREGGGKKMLSYLSGSTITDMLNDAFGYMWSWRIDKQWIQESQSYFNKYSKVAEKETYNGQQGAWESQGSVAHVLGVLTVYVKNGPGLITIEKAGYGSKSILGKQNDQESIFKAAGTDALKKAASLLGIGLELYRDEDEAAYFYGINYEDPWTDEAKADKAEQLAYMKKYITDYQVDDETFANWIYEITNGASYEVTPDNIDSVVDIIKSQLEAAE